MNKERLLALADLIEKGSHKFNGIHAAFSMANWLVGDTLFERRRERLIKDRLDHRSDIKDKHLCNTSACIAGWACLLANYDTFKVGYENHKAFEDREFIQTAKDYLGLNDECAYDLFKGCTSAKVTGPEAAKVIRNLVDTGVVSWAEVEERIYLDY